MASGSAASLLCDRLSTCGREHRVCECAGLGERGTRTRARLDVLAAALERAPRQLGDRIARQREHLHSNEVGYARETGERHRQLLDAQPTEAVERPELLVVPEQQLLALDRRPTAGSHTAQLVVVESDDREALATATSELVERLWKGREFVVRKQESLEKLEAAEDVRQRGEGVPRQVELDTPAAGSGCPECGRVCGWVVVHGMER